MLAKESIIDKIEVTAAGHLQVRFASRVTENGQPITPDAYHRIAFSPGDDLSLLTAETVPTVDQSHLDRVAVVAAAVWTPEVVAAYKAELAAEQARREAEAREAAANDAQAAKNAIASLGA